VLLLLLLLLLLLCRDGQRCQQLRRPKLPLLVSLLDA
jgi:hypothetical protein